MSKAYGCQTMYQPLRNVLVRPPDQAFGTADPERWHYTGQPDLAVATSEHEAFVGQIRENGAEMIVHDHELPDHADALYVHDPAIVTDRGAIILRMGKALRRGEEEAIEAAFEKAGVPIHAKLTGEALAVGGDLLWID